MVFIDPRGRSAITPQQIITGVGIISGVAPGIAPWIVLAGGTVILSTAVAPYSHVSDYNAGLVNVPGVGVFYAGNPGGNCSSNVYHLADHNSNIPTQPVVQTATSGGGGGCDRDKHCLEGYNKCFQYVIYQLKASDDFKLTALKRCDKDYEKCKRFPGEKIKFKYPEDGSNIVHP